MANLVYCDLVPRGSSTQLNLGQVTLAQVCLQVINLSPLQIELDRAQLVMQCGAQVSNCCIYPLASLLNLVRLNRLPFVQLSTKAQPRQSPNARTTL